VTIWNEHGEDDFYLKEGVNFEIVPWSTPLLHGIESVDLAPPDFDTITASLQIVNRELVSYLSRHPDQMYKLTPRKFEELVALLLSDMGYEVQLTPETRDRGRDILAVLRVPPGKEFLLIVECKRLAHSRKVGIDIVQRFLWVLDYQDKANGGLIATTSSFSWDAKRLAANHRWRLDLCEFDGLQYWLAQFGKWTRTERSGIWLPS
jgi:restriction endonuclease Mrr